MPCRDLIDGFYSDMLHELLPMQELFDRSIAPFSNLV